MPWWVQVEDALEAQDADLAVLEHRILAVEARLEALLQEQAAARGDGWAGHTAGGAKAGSHGRGGAGAGPDAGAGAQATAKAWAKRGKENWGWKGHWHHHKENRGKKGSKGAK